MTPAAISVVVPFHQSEDSIRACLDALLTQQDVEGRVELIFVNNNSTDGSATIVAEYETVTLLTESEPGAYAARNTGITHASAPIVAFTDADCVADERWLSRIAAAMTDPAVGIVIGHCRYPRTATWLLRALGAYENAKAEYVTRHGRPEQRFAYANNMAIRASVFGAIGVFKAWPRAADSEFVHRLGTHRPDLRLVYRDDVRVTHHEFRQARDRARRMALYRTTNARIEGFKELTLAQRTSIAVRSLARLGDS